MPLDTTQKIAHIQAVIARSYKGRQRTVVFVYLTSGVYSYTAVTAIFRPQLVVEPQIPNQSGGQPTLIADMVMIVPISTNMVGVVYVADTSTATSGGVAAAHKFEIIQAVPAGILPGGTHYQVDLRRLR